MILKNQELFIGILIEYQHERELKKSISLSGDSFKSGEPNVSFIGAGSFAQGTLLPNVKGKCNLIGVLTGSGTTSKYVGEKYGFNYCAATTDEIFEDENTNTVFITTRHNLHAENVIKAIEKGKNVFVEKPLGMNEQELEAIMEAYKLNRNIHLMVGFNRRFAPPVQQIMNLFDKEQPKSINIRVNAGMLPAVHWVNDPDIGGGRIIGEACHFIDLAIYLSGQ